MSSDEQYKLLNDIRRMLDLNPSANLLSITYRSLLVSQVFELITPEIASYLSFPQFIALTQVCKACRKWQGNVLLSYINALLKPYVSDPDALRKVMHKTGSIISGSTVLWFLEHCPSQWSPGDLDIYTPFRKTGPLIEFFISQGWSIIPNKHFDQSDTYMTETSQLNTCTKLQRGTYTIDILESATASVQEPLARFHCTMVMNYISAGTIKSFYPKQLFAHIGVIQTERRQRRSAWVNKYRDRLFCIKNLSEMSPEPGVCSKLLRHPDDKHCLTLNVPFHGENGTLHFLEENLNHTSWSWVLASDSESHSFCDLFHCVADQFEMSRQRNLTMDFIRKRTQESVVDVAKQCLDLPTLVKYLTLFDAEMKQLPSRILEGIQDPPTMIDYLDGLEEYSVEKIFGLGGSSRPRRLSAMSIDSTVEWLDTPPRTIMWSLGAP